MNINNNHQNHFLNRKKTKKLKKIEKELQNLFKKTPEKKKFEFHTGYLNIKNLYKSYIIELLFRILFSLSILYSIKFNNNNFLPVLKICLLINLLYILINFWEFFFEENKDQEKKSYYLVKIFLWICFFCFLLGFFLLKISVVDINFFFFSIFPMILINVFFLNKNYHEKNFYDIIIFSYLVAFQLIFIAVKIIFPFFHLKFAIFGILIFSPIFFLYGIYNLIILFINILKFILKKNADFKIKIEIFETFYFFGTVFAVFLLTKNLMFFFDENHVWLGFSLNLNSFGGGDFQTFFLFLFLKIILFLIDFFYMIDIPFMNSFVFTSVFICVFSLLKIFLILIWKKNILEFFKKKYDGIRVKKINSKFVKENDKLFFRKKSSIFFEKFSFHNFLTFENKENCDKNDICALCYENESNIILNCLHSGICDICIIKYLKKNKKICIFCKELITKFFLISKFHDDIYKTIAKVDLC